MKIRMYGKILKMWTALDERNRERLVQKEVAYVEYDVETGEVVGKGSEDFTPERWKGEAEERWLWTWDGERRNRGGHRWFDDHGPVKYRKSEKTEVKRYLLNKYRAADLQLRN